MFIECPMSHDIAKLALIPFVTTQGNASHICYIPKKIIVTIGIFEITYKTQFHLINN